jgi:hypothetical protein
MITYNAKDLIQQATMLADLQNSDFISWKENIMFLDNAWTELYQSLINHGDKTFLQEFTFSGSKTYLPDDFYQLYYISYSNGTYERPIARKAKTSTGQGPYYDIVGNELVIFRDNVNNLNKIRVQYYPIKQGITYRAPKKNLNDAGNLAYTSTIDIADHYALVHDTIDDSYQIWDLSNGSFESSDSGDVLYISGEKPKVASFDNSYFLIKKDNKILKATLNDTTLEIYKGINGALYKTFNNFSSLIYDTISKNNTATLIDDILYYVANNELHGYNLTTRTDNLISDISSGVVGFDDSIYYLASEGVKRDYTLILPTEDFEIYNGVLKEDLNTGYGILTDNYFVNGIYNDTELSFPNNFYYNFLAYKLGIYYKIKQNADPSGLMVALSDAEKTFYDTLPRDENSFVRISNAYAY